MKTRIFLVRHAEAEGNYYRRFHGQYDSLVTENGKRQIECLRRRFEREEVNACYASDLFRTRKTAEAVWLAKNLPLRPDARLREVAAGFWEDVPFGWLEEYDAENFAAFSKDPVHWHVHGAERYAPMTARFLRALDDIARENAGGTAAVFSHACVLGRALRVLTGGAPTPYCDNTAVSLLEYENGGWRIVYLNDASHIPEALSTFARQKWWRRGGDSRDFNLRYTEVSPGCWDAIQRDRAVGRVQVDLATGELLTLEMAEGHRGVALGPQLLGQAISALRKNGVQTTSATLAASHPAEHFFREQGFESQQTGSQVLWTKDLRVPKL